MKNGLPYYADGSGYKGDLSVSMEKEGRDERLQLFVFGEEDIVRSDPADPAVAKNNEVVILDTIPLVTSSVELQDFTGYRPRKYYNYDYDQYKSNTIICTTGAVVFRAAEAYLNYIEACYEKNGSLDNDAAGYWKAIRRRAGVSEDYELTIANTNLDKEANVVSGTVYGDLAVFSGRPKSRRNTLQHPSRTPLRIYLGRYALGRPEKMAFVGSCHYRTLYAGRYELMGRSLQKICRCHRQINFDSRWNK